MTTKVVHHAWADACRVGPEGQDPFEGHRVLLLGEDNPQSARFEYALWPVPAKGKTGCAGRNLQVKVLGVSHMTYYSLWRTNLCNPTWNPCEAEARAAGLTQVVHPWRTIVCLGRKVSTAVSKAIRKPVNAWSWTVCVALDDIEREHVVKIVSIPHPSGLTRDWNDASNYERARELLREVEPDVPWGELGRIPDSVPQGL